MWKNSNAAIMFYFCVELCWFVESLVASYKRSLSPVTNREDFLSTFLCFNKRNISGRKKVLEKKLTNLMMLIFFQSQSLHMFYLIDSLYSLNRS